MAMEAEKSHHLLFASTEQKARDVIQSKSEGRRTKGADGLSPSEGLSTWRVGRWCKSWVLKVREPGTLISESRKRWTSQLKERDCPSSTFFVLFRPSADGLMLTVNLNKTRRPYSGRKQLFGIKELKCRAHRFG